jgi:lipopolysaccharide/colanic/teichoic acid biosynthesis glycosyltransferase
MYKLFFKGWLDFIIALSALIVLSPLILLVAILLYFLNNGNIFFTQERPGKNGRIFKVVKFRTMNNQKDALGKLLPDQDRLTGIGKFVRSSSIDELPQLINVIKGDMSLIGPRPLLPKYLPLYDAHQMRRHLVKPGITGWAQVNGRNAISWEQKFDLDVWYVEHQGFLLDMKIIWITLTKIINRDGINAADAATMPPFTGSKN